MNSVVRKCASVIVPRAVVAIVFVLAACVASTVAIASQRASLPSSGVGQAGPGSAFPATIQNCGVSQTYTAPPKHVVTMNQTATEIMLALGLQDRMVGTAYLDDAVLPEFASAYRAIPVVAVKYPSREALLGIQPDFVYSTYASAFADRAAGSRASLSALGIASYLSPPGCSRADRPKTVSMDTVFGEIRDIGRIFGVSAKAEQLIAGYQTQLTDIQKRIGTVAKAPRVLWYDSEDPPFVAACCGVPNEIMRLAGADNLFKDAAGAWATVSWEAVIARNPEVVVLINAVWAPAAEKQKVILGNKAYSSVDAVKAQRFVAIDFSDATPGVRTVRAIRKLAEALYPQKFR